MMGYHSWLRLWIMLFAVWAVRSICAEPPETKSDDRIQQPSKANEPVEPAQDSAAVPSGLANGQPAELQFEDNFQEDRLRQYEVDGEVKWTSGAMLLKPGARLTGPVAMGPVADVEFTFENVPGDAADNSETWFGMVLANGWRAGVLLNRVPQEKPEGDKPVPSKTESGGDFELQITTTIIDADSKEATASIVRKCRCSVGPSGQWLVRYNHGVVEAWHDGNRLLCGDCGFGGIALQAVEISPRQHELRLVHLRLAAREPVAAPKFDDPAARQKLVEQWQVIAARSNALFQQGKFDEYLDIARKQVDIEERVAGPQSLIPIRTRTQIALALEQTEQHTEAMAEYDRLLPVCQEQLGQRHPQTGLLLRSRGLCHAKLRQYDEAIDDLRHAVSILSEVHGEEHPEAMFALDVYGFQLDSAGHLREAEQVTSQAIVLHERVDGEESPRIVLVLRQLARIQRQMGKQRAEVETLDHIVSLKSRSSGEAHAETLDARELLADAWRRSGDHGRARRLLEENLQYQMQAGDAGQQATAKTLQALANMSLEVRDLDAAQSFAERAMTVAGKIGPRDKLGLAEACLCLGDVFQAREEYQRAAEQYHRACQECDQAGRSEQLLLATAFERLSMLEFLRGDFAAALKQGQQALQMRREMDGPLAAGESGIHEQLGNIYKVQGELESAQTEYELAIQIYDAASDAASDDLPRCWVALAELAERREQWDQAIEWNQKSLDYYRQRFGPEHRLVANALYYLAITHQLHHDWARAAELQLESLLLQLKLSRGLISTLSETEALTYVRKLCETRDGLLGLHRLVKTTPRNELEQQLVSLPVITPEDLYAIVWATKGVATRAVAARRIKLSDSPMAHAVWQNLIDTRGQLAELALAGAGVDSAFRAERLIELTETKERLERQLAQESTSFRTDQETELVSYRDLLAVLPADVAVIDFLHSTTPARKIANREDTATNNYEAFVLRSSQAGSTMAVQWVHIGPGEAIEEAVQAWRQSRGGRGATISDNTASALTWQETGARLRTLVWEKLAPHLSGIKTVLIVPDGSLARVPWAALPGNKPGTFLIEDFALATVDHPQRLITLLRQPPPSGKRLLVMGGLDYDKRPESGSRNAVEPRLADANAASPPRTTADAMERGVPTASGERLHWTALPGTANEAEQIAELAGSRFEVRHLKTDGALETDLESVLPSCRFIHLATHGYFADAILRSPLHDESKPIDTSVALLNKLAFSPRLESRHPLLLSGLVLTGANIAPQPDAPGARVDRDGILTGEEITQIDLSQAELVTLSACETGLGVVADGEGVLGLQRAFATAGARTVVASLWKVDDAATQALMTEFYRNLWDRGLSKIESLRQAQLTMLRFYDVKSGRLLQQPPSPAADGRATPPFYWAAFSLSGDWR